MQIQIFVVKRYWRLCGPKQTGSLSYLPEGDRYRRVPSREEHIYSSEDVKINDTLDSTLEFVRRGLQTQCPQRPESTSKKQTVRDENRRDHQDATQSKDKSKEDLLYSCSNETKPVTSRVHMQVIRTYSGWSLRHFKDLKELLGVISDIIKGIWVIIRLILLMTVPIAKNISNCTTKASYFIAMSVSKISESSIQTVRRKGGSSILITQRLSSRQRR